MTPPWSKPLEVDRLADGGADIDFAVPLGELSGLRSARAGVSGEVNGRVHFTRQRGLVVAQLELKGLATLECQRCMKPMQHRLDSKARVALLGSEADAARVPEELEPMLAPGGRISIAELITEELLLTLPIVPLHVAGAPCAVAAAAPAVRPEGEMQTPFAQLGELLKRQ